ncbi:SRPBCC family protein [Streptomyces sp. CB03911]|uniref:SRPBCC family protein n=1 Tax=Streptomycetaceae TaxID=2062 RepID=UPI000939C2D8|nr:SRPBCC family protein [Streptomyces sp. CB03911]OKI31017.1 polyketide cyclase [Streptomyces sp. CB03911]
MDLSTYRLSSTWQFDASPGPVLTVLADVAGYPRWWPQVRTVRQTAADAGELVVRSLLPYRLVFTVQAARQDEAAGVLEARMTGDLVGWSRWTVTAQPTGTHVLFEEEARLGKPLLRLLAAPARPAFLANHAAMMRGGERGLRDHLAAEAGQ